MAKRSQATKTKPAPPVRSPSPEASSSPEPISPPQAPAQQQQVRRATPAFNSTAGRVVLFATLATTIVEVYQLAQLLRDNEYRLDNEFYSGAWEILKGYWQSKLLAATYIIKTLLAPPV